MATMTALQVVPLAMVSNQFFDEFTDKVRVKPIPWEGFSRAGLVTGSELHELQEFQQKNKRNEDGQAEYVGVLLGLLSKLSSLDAQQYLLVKLDDLVENDVGALKELGKSYEEAEQVLFRCMEKKDDFLGLKAAKILVGLSVGLQRECKFERLFGILERYLKSELTSVVDVAVQIVQAVLGQRRARTVLYDECPGCLKQLVDVLRRTLLGGRAPRGVVAVPQTQYEVVYCLWMLTFESRIAQSINRIYDVVPVMVDIARAAVKEKVIRIIVATWINLANKAPEANMPNMLVAKVPACLQTLGTGRNLKDEDLKADIGALAETLAAHTGAMTTWDEYLTELASGKLHWSPAHRSEQFWKLHIRRMDESDHKVVRLLGDILAASTSDDTALAVACHDLSQYVKLNPDGKKLLARIGAKTRVMALMTSASPEVRYEALMCVQQIMLNAWRN
ncbi:H(+)-transporting V1 sector ATPase subunit H [Coemansia erecta]|uniref:V-type proton ATPase subunit H n=1 Tax=Coemansia asiatica TaxID=1052880 RepID=A0A9W8CHR8_9FUNG|nr:H(+)-transporting V1 sector ATPase subunit H [Coemansia asiatica]KAJ2858107.1 H(+)-transporting V1 sector ATPase subunit H [Coemansia erecta]